MFTDLFLSLFLSKHQKMVKRWREEHVQIVKQAKRVIAEYSKHNRDQAKEELRKLSEFVIDHILDEDVELYQLLILTDGIDPKVKHEITAFQESFKATKSALMSFLIRYTHEKAVLDDAFFAMFNDVVAKVLERIEFEEKNLYALLHTTS